MLPSVNLILHANLCHLKEHIQAAASPQRLARSAPSSIQYQNTKELTSFFFFFDYPAA